jgi:hypothetical protein
MSFNLNHLKYIVPFDIKKSLKMSRLRRFYPTQACTIPAFGRSVVGQLVHNKGSQALGGFPPKDKGSRALGGFPSKGLHCSNRNPTRGIRQEQKGRPDRWRPC